MHPTELPYDLIYDADSHIMPTRSWLKAYMGGKNHALIQKAIPDWEAALSPFYEQALRTSVSFGSREGCFHHALIGPKSAFAPGALDCGERSELLTALGIGSQLVFSTFVMPRLCGRAFTQSEAALVSRAHNRGITEFCSQDCRLVAAGVVSFHDPQAALFELSQAINDGIGAIQVPTDAFWGRSPSHAQFEPFWETCEAENIAVISHIGGGQLLPGAYHLTGLGLEEGAGGAGETLRPKDFAVAHHSVERFLTCMILDGVFERHEHLRVGVIEQGASWLVGFMRRLDQAAYHFRSDRVIAKLSMKPSDYILRQVRVTPYFFEDVGWLISELGEDLLMFSTDYPHFEGGTDPVGRFEAGFDAAGIRPAARRNFYIDNYRNLISVN